MDGPSAMTSGSHVHLPGRDERFGAIYSAHFDSVLAYALRRCPVAEDAADVAAETFLVAWRRLDAVPPGDQARPYLYGVARKVLGNHRRGAERRSRLGERLRRELPAAVPDHAERHAATDPVRAVLARLRDTDREVLELALWEGLEPRDIAHALGTSAGSVRTRLSRARSTLRAELGADAGNASGGAGHAGDDRPSTARRGGGAAS